MQSVSRRAASSTEGEQQAEDANARHSYLRTLRTREQSGRQQQQVGSRSRYLQTLRVVPTAAPAAHTALQIVVSHTTVRDAAAESLRGQGRSAPRKRPRYDNSRRAAKAKARSAARPCKITLQDRRGNADRIRALLERQPCECSREICFCQFRTDPEDVIAIIQEFARLPKAARDGLLCCREANQGIECVLAGRHMGPRCFARILGIHHGIVYKKGARVDLRLRHWMAPRRCPRARPQRASIRGNMCS